jgi:hypothetical protein
VSFPGDIIGAAGFTLASAQALRSWLARPNLGVGFDWLRHDPSDRLMKFMFYLWNDGRSPAIISEITLGEASTPHGQGWLVPSIPRPLVIAPMSVTDRYEVNLQGIPAGTDSLAGRLVSGDIKWMQVRGPRRSEHGRQKDGKLLLSVSIPSPMLRQSGGQGTPTSV